MDEVREFRYSHKSDCHFINSTCLLFVDLNDLMTGARNINMRRNLGVRCLYILFINNQEEVAGISATSVSDC